jgi:hypothetical protein
MRANAGYGVEKRRSRVTDADEGPVGLSHFVDERKHSRVWEGPQQLAQDKFRTTERGQPFLHDRNSWLAGWLALIGWSRMHHSPVGLGHAKRISGFPPNLLPTTSPDYCSPHWHLLDSNS